MLLVTRGNDSAREQLKLEDEIWNVAIDEPKFHVGYACAAVFADTAANIVHGPYEAGVLY